MRLLMGGTSALWPWWALALRSTSLTRQAVLPCTTLPPPKPSAGWKIDLSFCVVSEMTGATRAGCDICVPHAMKQTVCAIACVFPQRATPPLTAVVFPMVPCMQQVHTFNSKAHNSELTVLFTSAGGGSQLLVFSLLFIWRSSCPSQKKERHKILYFWN